MKNWLFPLLVFIILCQPAIAGLSDELKDEIQADLQSADSLAVDSAAAEIADDAYYSDSAMAVDDAVWQQMGLAQEYYTQGVAANQEASWEEAQYYLEKALQILANLDIDTVNTSPEASRYTSLLNHIVADYRLTMLSLGSMPEDASPSAFIEKYIETPEKAEVKVEGEKEPVTYDVPIVFNERVKKSIIYLQTVARDAFHKYLERSGRYIPLMSEILRQYGLPGDIVYLPLIESGFNCRAYSWARASGPWQFIGSTGRLYDLERTWWYDERRDFIKSTHAAARFLKFLYGKFDSWELALAAYNGGPGRIESTIKRQRTTNFWDMDLRKQTEDYVPIYMAATIIAKNPELYGFHVEFDDPLLYDEVTIDRCLDLKAVARATETSLETIEDLNPELLRGVTPPGVKNYTLRIPVGKTPQFLASLPDLKSAGDGNWGKHKIRNGETISSIASHYGVSQYALREANGLSQHSHIFAGKYLLIPVPPGGNSQAPQDVPKRVATEDNTYIVQRNDNLWDVSRAFGTTPEKLRKLNYLGNSSRIYVGQVLRLPGSAGSAPRVVRKDDADRPAAGTREYVVKKGDTLWDIAKKYGTTTATLRRINDIDRNSRLYVGQKLLVADSDPGRGRSDYYIYIVRRGDTLSRIAQAFGTTVQSLSQLNDLDDSGRLDVGMRLKIAK